LKREIDGLNWTLEASEICAIEENNGTGDRESFMFFL